MLDLHLINLQKLLSDMVPILSITIGNKDIELLFNLSGSIPDCILVDGLRLQQVLLNLLNNAIKFTKQGEIIFSVLPIDIKKKKVTLSFSVRDTGIGISPDKLARIFDAFSQAETTTTRRFGGTGLGLTISQKLVQLMGGELSVESTPEIGSHFYFRLSCPIGTSKECEKIKKVNHEPLFLKCLLVDDNASARKIIGDMLRSFGWIVEEAADSAKAIKTILKNDSGVHFDIAYIDYRMPGVDGWETCERIRALNLKNTLKLILMSRIYDSNEMDHFQNSQLSIVDGYLLKPVTPSCLFDAAANLYLSSTLKNKLALAPPSISGHLNGLNILLVEDNLTNQVVAHDLLVSEGAQVMVCENPYDVLDIIKKSDPLFNVILTDLQMPGMDGFTLTKKIRKKYSAQLLPIIAISANIFEESRVSAIKVGMNDFVCKPFRLEELVSTILQVARIDSTPKNFLDFDEKEALKRFGGNREIYAHSLSTFTQDVRDLLNELPKSFTKETEAFLHSALHTLKGAAATVGANALAILASDAYQKLKEDSLSNKAWLAYHRALNATGLDAIKSAQKISKEWGDESPKPPILINQLPLLKELISYLETSNMKALTIYTKLKQKMGTDELLDDAMMRLDFKAAESRCRDLMNQHREEGI
ncbi:MAG: response regulator [Gammaproteobacteria bacterium]|nr:response regulator [Gammaproteobacteria bacterium]